MALVDTGLSGRLNPGNKLPFPKIEKPYILGCFSVNTNRDFVNSAENFRYFRMPNKMPLDLNIGYGHAKSKQEQMQDERLDHPLQFIQCHQDELLSKPENASNKGVGEFDFICFRGLLRLLMCTPYESREDWCIHATRYKGNIYMSQKETDQKRHQRYNETENQKKFCSYGYKFEQYCMTHDPSEEPNTNTPVDECEEFYCMYKTKIQGMEILFGAEVDGALSSAVAQNIESREELNSLKLVELKCSLRPANKRQQQNFYRFKCRNWWCQSFLVGIQDLMVGYRNDKGLVDEIKHMEVRSLPKLASNYWAPSQCADFLVKFLQMLKNTMKDVNCPHTVYEFYFDPRSKMIGYRIYRNEPSHTLLPDWYVTMLQQRSNV
ncbi:decapping nuclease DXO homolog [Episyrphus balteatus]|uniref:decapping nuclease DXO homolog n=1 Tax=Episyrphus balteatus TaxID=286459 RepID=UPI0024869E32|nr:decapping nuclease DXO homolog [Episyrphus balteatus]